MLTSPQLHPSYCAEHPPVNKTLLLLHTPQMKHFCVWALHACQLCLVDHEADTDSIVAATSSHS
jgi:hypothetical protein